MARLEGVPSWIVGVVEVGERCASVIDNPRVIEVGEGGNFFDPVSQVPSVEQEGQLW